MSPTPPSRDDLGLLRELIELPTVPFAESAVIELAGRYAIETGAELSPDSAGNLWLSWSGLSDARPGWVLAAHLDHPGFRVVAAEDREAEALWLGGVDRRMFEGARVRILSAPPVLGRVVRVVAGIAGAVRMGIRFEHPVPVGAIGSWDLPPLMVDEDWIAAPAVDDLAGVAWALGALRSASEHTVEHPVLVLLTRAEEAGFVGALMAVREPRGLEDAWINLDASPAIEETPPGDGVVIRTGDAWSEFDADLAARLEEIAARAPAVPTQVARMPGGVCEGTVFRAAGRRCGALALPLRYHHNQGPRGTPMLERCHRDDFLAGARLTERLVLEPPPVATGRGDGRQPALLARLERWAAPFAPMLGGSLTPAKDREIVD